MRLAEPIPLRSHSENYCLMATVAVPAGEPLEIESELEKVDFNEYLTGCAEGVYLIRISGDSMEAEISHGDTLVEWIKRKKFLRRGKRKRQAKKLALDFVWTRFEFTFP